MSAAAGGPPAPGNPPSLHSGSCLCGTVRFVVRGPLPPIEICHCVQCRKAQGSAFAANLPVARAEVTWLAGAEHLRACESSPGKRRHFCGRCGSPVYSERTAVPDRLRLRAGLLDGPLGVRPVSHAWVGEKADWWDIEDRLPRLARGR